MRILIAISLLIVSSSPASAEWVNGHMRSNGTYVQGYQRSAPDNSAYNNRGYYEGTQPRNYESQHYGNQYNSYGNSYNSGYTRRGR